MKVAQPYKPKILIISGAYPNMKCGVGSVLGKLVENLIAMGANISLLTSRDLSVKREAYVHALIKRWNIFSIFKILLLSKKERPELRNLHVPTVKYKAILNIVSFLPLLAKIFLKFVPFIITVHDYAIAQKIFKIFYLPLFIFSDKIIMTNANDAEDLIKCFPFLRNKLKKIYLGPTIDITHLSVDEVEKFYEKIKHKKEGRFISTFGFIKRSRHIDKILWAFHRLSKYDNGLKLIILGRPQNNHDLEYRSYLLNLIKNLSLTDRVFWFESSNSRENSFYLSISDLALLFYERGASFRRSTMINYIVREIPVITNINKKYGIDKDLLASGMTATIDSIAIDEIYEKAKLVLYDKDYSEMLKKKMKMTDRIFNWKNSASEMIDICMGLINKKKCL